MAAQTAQLRVAVRSSFLRFARENMFENRTDVRDGPDISASLCLCGESSFLRRSTTADGEDAAAWKDIHAVKEHAARVCARGPSL
jgi:hypothetical protein